MSAILEVEELTAGYGDVVVVRDLSLRVEAGEVVALLGPNGAGKTTTLLTIAGLLPPKSGEVRLDGVRQRGRLHQRARNGLAFISEERSIIRRVSARDNLRMVHNDIDKAIELFPELEPLLDRPAGLLSGGEQQMLALGRALSADPRLLVIDELSLGLAPLVVARLLTAVRAAADRGVGVLIVEQHARQALRHADRGYLLRRGRIELEGAADELLRHADEIEVEYLR